MTNGFHLIELLVTLIIIAILATLSIPLYSQHIVHERRLEAIQTLGKLALAMETYFIQYQSYNQATLSALHFSQFIAAGNYQLTIRSATNFEYALTAKPIGVQAKKDRACGALTLNSKGAKGITGFGSVEACW